MKRRYALLILFVGLVLLAFAMPIWGQSGDEGIQVIDADEIWLQSTVSSQELIDATNNVAPRTVVQYANKILHFGLSSLPAELDNLLQMVQARVVIQYANRVLHINLSSLPAELDNLLQMVQSRIIIQYANSNQTVSLVYPDGLFGTITPPLDIPLFLPIIVQP